MSHYYMSEASQNIPNVRLISSTTNTVSNIVKKNVVTIPQPYDTIYYTFANCSIPSTGINHSGDCFFTTKALMFIPRSNNKAWMIEVNWKDISSIEKASKRAMDKGIELSIGDIKIIFTQMNNRNIFWDYIIFLSNIVQNQKPTYGFNKRDDAEVVRRLTILRAPHAFDTVLNAELSDIITMLKSPELFTESLEIAGCNDVVAGSWNKTKDGIFRLIQYTQPLFQNTTVQQTQTLMKSGDTAVLELFLRLSRPSINGFLHVPMQFYLKKAGEKVSFRCAYSMDWINDVWDKEFVEAAVGRTIRVMFHYAESKANKSKFDESEFEGQWRKHQPFVLVIVGLLLLLLGVCVVPDSRAWYRALCGFIAIAMFIAL